MNVVSCKELDGYQQCALVSVSSLSLGLRTENCTDYNSHLVEYFFGYVLLLEFSPSHYLYKVSSRIFVVRQTNWAANIQIIKPLLHSSPYRFNSQRYTFYLQWEDIVISTLFRSLSTQFQAARASQVMPSDRRRITHLQESLSHREVKSTSVWQHNAQQCTNLSHH